MTSEEYWVDRFEELARIQAVHADEAEALILAEYEKATQSIMQDIELFYARYAKTNDISLVEAKKLLSKPELRGWQMSLEEFIEKSRNNSDGQWNKILDSEYIKSRVSRLEALQIQIRGEVEIIKQKQNEITALAISETFADTYYRTAFEIAKGVGYELNFAMLNTEAIQKAAYTAWLDGKNFSDRIWIDKDKLLRELNTNLMQGIIRGDSPDKMIGSLQKRMNVSRKRAADLVQTETANVMGEATAEIYGQFGVKKYEFLGTLDLHTCGTCGGLDGKKIDLKDKAVGVNYPPLHPGCRCSTAPYIDDKVIGTRAARDPVTGKTISIQGNIKYKEWKHLLQMSGENGIIRLPDGTYARMYPGSKMEDIEIFAGPGSKKELRVKQHLANNYGGDPEKWTHVKGRGYLEIEGKPKKAMIHWFEEPDVGIVEMKVKGWSKK